MRALSLLLGLSSYHEVRLQLALAPLAHAALELAAAVEIARKDADVAALRRPRRGREPALGGERLDPRDERGLGGVALAARVVADLRVGAALDKAERQAAREKIRGQIRRESPWRSSQERRPMRAPPAPETGRNRRCHSRARPY